MVRPMLENVNHNCTMWKVLFLAWLKNWWNPSRVQLRELLQWDLSSAPLDSLWGFPTLVPVQPIPQGMPIHQDVLALQENLIHRCAIIRVHFQDIIISTLSLRKFAPCCIFSETLETEYPPFPSQSDGWFLFLPLDILLYFSRSPAEDQLFTAVPQKAGLLPEPKPSLCDIISHPSSCVQEYFFFKATACPFFHGAPPDEVQKDSYSLLILTAFQTAVENVTFSTDT